MRSLRQALKRTLITAGIAASIATAYAPMAYAAPNEDSPAWDCRYQGNRICGPGNAQGVLPGWYGDVDCWPGAVWCPDIDAPYSAARVHPGAPKLHSWDCLADNDDCTEVDYGPSTMPSGNVCEIDLYTGVRDCSGRPHGADWDIDPASGPNAYDLGAYVGGYN